MLRNLQAEMARNGVQTVNIAKVINRSERATRDKVSGKFDFTLPEAFAIRDTYFPGMTMEYLFATDDDITRPA